jgi:hypothetical protein
MDMAARSRAETWGRGVRSEPSGDQVFRLHSSKVILLFSDEIDEESVPE